MAVYRKEDETCRWRFLSLSARSTLSMQWDHNAAVLGLPPVRGARVVGESPPRYYFLCEGATTGQSHPRPAPPPPSACAYAAPLTHIPESETSAPVEGVSYGAADSGANDPQPRVPARHRVRARGGSGHAGCRYW